MSRADPGFTPRHRALVVEDDATLAPGFAAMFRRLKVDHTLVTTLEAAEAALARGGFCVVATDLKIPAADGFPAELENGYAVIRVGRQLQPDRELLSIIAMTAYGNDHTYCVRAIDLGANTFSKKGKQDERPSLEDRICEWLAKGCERRFPDGCPNAQGKAPRTYGSSVRLVLDGEPVGKRFRVALDAKPAELTHQHVTLLVKLTRADQLLPDGLVSYGHLGFSSHESFRKAIDRLIAELAEHGAGDVVVRVDKQARINTKHVKLGDALKGRFKGALAWEPRPQPGQHRDSTDRRA